MQKANYTDKELIVDILAQSFNDNKSVNYIIKQDESRESRLKKLMAYSFNVCYWYGDVLFSDDKKACALIVYPDKKKTTLKSIWLDVKLALGCIGLGNLPKAMKRESAIKKVHPVNPFAYLWFIGVKPHEQNKGAGTALLNEILLKTKAAGLTVILETSVERNLPWYKKHGFVTYKELDFGYRLYCMKSGL
jgi:ribosomal protein S18 acetylase RimI-like enzyme